MMDDQTFGLLIDQLNTVVRETVIRVALVNQELIYKFDELEEAMTPVGVNGFELMLYERLSDDHVCFFSSKEDAQEFIDACEDLIAESNGADPQALVGVVIELKKQSLIKSNNRIQKELGNGENR